MGLTLILFHKLPKDCNNDYDIQSFMDSKEVSFTSTRSISHTIFVFDLSLIFYQLLVTILLSADYSLIAVEVEVVYF